MNATLVVGASQAGMQLAVSLRAAGDRGPIVLLGSENSGPYQRPPLSKAFLAGDGDTRALAFRQDAFYRDHDIELLTGQRVTELEVERDGSAGTATTATRRTLEFARLALCVGARVRRLPVPGADLAGVHHLRDVDDATAIRASLRAARRVVVVGGGFIGLECAAAATSLGAHVSVVEAGDRLLGRAVAPVVSEFFRTAHSRRGVEVRLGAAVTAIRGHEGRATGVVLDDGTTVPADTVVVGIGVAPRTELAEEVGLECDPRVGGIVVDADARASGRDGLVAAGDCTARPHPVTGRGRVRLESVQNAVSQAKVAAAHLAGRPRPAAEPPWFWSDQGELKLQIAGLADGHDETVLRGDPDEEHFSVLYYRQGELIAVDAVNTPADYLVVRKVLTRGGRLPLAAAADTTRALRDLVLT